LEKASYYSVQNLSSSHLLYKRRLQYTKLYFLPIVLYGCETWSLTLEGEHRLRVFENRVVRNIFGMRREEVVGG
jgi:hypothetical protein